MKFFAVLAVFIAVAHANVLPIPVSPVSVGQEQAEIQEILAAIQHPDLEPATAAALEQILLGILGVSKPEEDFDSISVGPAVVDESAPIVPAPVVEYSSASQVQIILNISNIEIDTISGSPVTITGVPTPFSAVVVDQINPTPVAVVDAEIAPSPVVVVLDDQFEPISVGPAVVDGENPISVGPAIVDESAPIVPAPFAPATPLIQIILNIKDIKINTISGSPVSITGIPFPFPAVAADQINPTPVAVVDAEIAPSPVVVEELVPEPVVIGTPVLPAPIVVAPIEPTPVVVEEPTPEAVIIGTPIIPSPVAVLPDELN